MKSFLVFLSVLLVFAGITAILINNITGFSLQQKHHTFKSTQPLRNEFVVKKHSMREIDSISAAINLSYTIANAVALSDKNKLHNLSAGLASKN